MTKLELIQQAVEQLQSAIDTLDQAHSTLIDAELDSEIPRKHQAVSMPGIRRPEIAVRYTLNIEQLVESAIGLLGVMQQEECDEMEKEMSK
jgi:hypothetical protein